jgi:hypothetical protein
MGRRPHLRGGRFGAKGAFGRAAELVEQRLKPALSPGKKKQRIKNRLGQAMTEHGFDRRSIQFRPGGRGKDFRVEIALNGNVFSFTIKDHEVQRPIDYEAQGGSEEIAKALELIVSTFAH